MQEQNSSHIVSGRNIAQIMKDQIRTDVELLTARLKRKPKVISFIVGENKESELYLKLRNNACAEVGIETSQKAFSSSISEEELIYEIKKSNQNPVIDGIFVQLPLPSHLDTSHVLSFINPKKDVEGFTAQNMGFLVTGNSFLVPCTPKAVLKILDHHRIQLKGAHVVIVNHSTVVGKPLALLCLKRNATVSVAHVFTKNLKKITAEADVLITAAGVPSLIKEDFVKDGAVVIDVAIVKTDQGITGDVDFDEVKQKTSLITPVPGGVGPVTIAAALENMVQATQAQLDGE